MFSLTSRTCVVQFMSGNTARSFGVRQLAAAFLQSAAPEAVLHTRRHVFCNQLLTKCKFHKSFILTFMQNAGGVGGILDSPTLKPFALSTFCIHPLCFDTLAHSLAFFCTFLHSRKTQPVSFQSIPHSLPKTPGVGYPCATAARSSGQAAPAFFSPLWKLLLPNVESFGSDLSCV